MNKKYCYQIRVRNSIDSFVHRIIHRGEGRDDQKVMAQAISISRLEFDFDEDPNDSSMVANIIKVVETYESDSTFRE